MGKYGNSNKYCSVPQCKSRCTKEISLFFFPKDEALRKRWADAVRIEKPITPHLQVCSRHFLKNDYILSDYPGVTKVRRLKKSSIPTQNLPWQFPNKRVSPSLAKARMERLKNRSQLKTSDAPEHKPDVKQQEPKKRTASPHSNDEAIDDDDEKLFKSNDCVKKYKPVEQYMDIIDKSKNVIATKIDNGTDHQQGVNKSSEAKKKEINMRARAPTRLRQRKGILKCEFCGRKCLTPQALRTHQQIAHKNAKNNQINPEKKPPAMSKTKQPTKPSPVAFISVKQRELLIAPPSLTKVNKSQKSLDDTGLVEQVLRDFDCDGVGTETDYSSEDSDKEELLKPEKKDHRRIEFECPKCIRRFAVFFSAVRHIHKHHPGAQKGDKASSNLPPVLKPNRIEICTICNGTLNGDVHLCMGPLKLAFSFICTGCNQEFKTLTLFDMHKSGMHSEGVESMFFPTLDEFESWKRKMEGQTKVHYTILDQNDTKKIHRCTHLHNEGVGTRARSRMCPSSIIVQEFTKGFQVHYYPKHYGHDFDDYKLSNAFKKYSIASLMNMTASQLPDDSDDDAMKETDLYLQFKKIIELLVNDAARINVNGLKKLMRKALEMINIVNSYDEDDDMTSTLSISPDNDDLQEQVKKALRGFKKSEQLKRPSTGAMETPPTKKSKPVFKSTENTLKESSSKVARTSNTSVIKIKEGIENVKCDVKKETPETPKNVSQSSSFIDSFEEFVGKTMVKAVEKKKPKNEGKKKKVVKTKIGQFKPSPPKTRLSPVSNPVSPSRRSIGSVKEIKYEVKEQDNDCNILILKI